MSNDNEREESDLIGADLTDEEPLALEADPEPLAIDPVESPIGLVGAGEEPHVMRQFGRHALEVKKTEFRRTLNVTGKGATRCRLFHSRIAVAPLEHLEQQVNEWLDSEDIEIKHVGQSVGIMEGKTAKPNLVVMVWY